MEDQKPISSNLLVKATERIISIGQLKRFAAENFRVNSVLRELLLAEPDNMSPVEFVAKMQTWLFLLRRKED
jgi:hypothetical protein